MVRMEPRVNSRRDRGGRWHVRLRRALANVPSKQLPAAVGIALLGVGLFLLSSYLSTRFDRGTPVSHSVDPFLTVWLSLVDLTVVLAAWVVAALPRTRRQPGITARRAFESRRTRAVRARSRTP